MLVTLDMLIFVRYNLVRTASLQHLRVGAVHTIGRIRPENEGGDTYEDMLATGKQTAAVGSAAGGNADALLDTVGAGNGAGGHR